jgi:small ligand-binding sensory domain FIST
VEAVSDVFGKAVLTGFYSNGEISPFADNAVCKLHNQTMTITYLTER